MTFSKSLGRLMSTLSASQPHYIRCIKPGKGAQAGVFDPTVVTDQLRCALDSLLGYGHDAGGP